MKLFSTLRPRAALVILFSLMLGSFLTARAQFLDQGALTGVVQDASGAAIPGAEVRLANPETSFTQTTKSNASGVYVFSPIKIGNYLVTVRAEWIPADHADEHLGEHRPASQCQHQDEAWRSQSVGHRHRCAPAVPNPG